MNQSLTLQTLNSARMLIEKANISQLKEIISRAEALKVYAAQAKKGLEIQNQCAEIKLRAERRIGEQLKKEVKAGNPQLLQDETIGLKELGIERIQSHRWQAVASLPEKEFEKHIAEVKRSNEELTTIGVIRLAKEFIRPKQSEIQKLPKGKYNVIYADPAWEYDRTVGQGVAIDQYMLMPLEEIKKMKILEISAEDCLLFLWATFPKLIEALEVIKAWGFEYKTVGFIWIKTNKNNNKPFFGIGSYLKSNAEVCLLATKGEPHSLIKDNSLSSVIISPIQEHSRKPEEARKRIEKLVGNVPKIELFSRTKVNGWKMWGNEIERF